jgi:hypothetical protein
VTHWNRDLHCGSGWLQGHHCGWLTSQPSISSEAAVIQLSPFASQQTALQHGP